ncbi:FGGY-family carbohydrate kinase [Pseudovibrio sp. Tun.PSC04-5.I4]|uniref:FGGY-family carbohydrate kinase n=1 Tax=Pseudovibrio sp. Tun.PSC04-5.I4 TaxID=1798213 RepID=UPI000886ABB5|nr:FGGY-family carbohydrate kinase [Pseudovibrio sp. Tun.PSC04-5.I4]SDQ76250.1 Sugar (pentulose or hexulose) kinase [Pseudovibrio sp. Tun.PSC04-5.I4]
MTGTLLAIDCGSQSIRALLFSPDGTLMFKVQKPIQAYTNENPGWSEIQPEVFWDLLGDACQELWQLGADPNTVKGMSVTTQRGTQIAVDADGTSLRPAITWMDERIEKRQTPLPLLWKTVFGLAGLSRSIKSVRSECEANWIKVNQPEIWENTHKFLQVSGYLNHKLTGLFRDSTGAQVGYVPFDYKKQKWASPNHFLWKLFAVKPSHLPELVEPGKIIGHLTQKAAHHTALPEGLPIISAAADKACEVLGSGATDATVGCLSYGTRATATIHSRKYFEVERPLPAYAGGVPNMYTPEASVILGYWMVNWFKEEFGHPEQEKARVAGSPVEVFFDDLLNSTPPGSHGLTLLPKWGRDNGRSTPVKGAIIGFGDRHTRGHIYRAIIEGITLELRRGLSRIERKSGEKITVLRVSGGGSQSDAIMQITADVFGLPTERPHTFETAGLGAAIAASVGVGIHSSFDQAMQAMTRQSEVFEPDPKTVQLYQQLYNNVYLAMPARLAPLNKALRKITG